MVFCFLFSMCRQLWYWTSLLIENKTDILIFHLKLRIDEWLERLIVNVVVATVLGSIQASSDTVEYRTLSWVWFRHPPTQWNLRGGRWSSVEYRRKIQKIPLLNKNIHLTIQSTKLKIKQCLKFPVGLLWQPWLARVDTYEHNCTCRLYYGMVTPLLTTRRFTVYIFLKNV